MSIDNAMSTLQRLKEGGATHLYVAVNCDHHSYTFTGVCYNVASEGDIESIKKDFYVAPYSVYGYPVGSLWEQVSAGLYRSANGMHYLPKEIVEGWEKIRK